MVNSIKSLFEIDENTARKFTVVHVLENCVNNIKYSMLSTVLTASRGVLQKWYTGRLHPEVGPLNYPFIYRL